MTVPSQAPTSQEGSADSSSDFGPLTECVLGWVFPAFSPTFYYHVGRRPVWRAVLFFLVFVLAVTIVSTLSLSNSLRPVRAAVTDAFRTGDLPLLTVADGELTVNGHEPFVRQLDYGLLVIDTTGRFGQKDLGPGRNKVSLLFTKTEYISYEDGQIQRLSYRDMQPLLGSQPFEFNAQTIMHWLDILVVGFFFTFGLASTVGWLAYVAFCGLILWGLASWLRKGAGFHSVLISGVYALTPAWYGYRLCVLLLPSLAFFAAWLVHSAFWVFGLICMLYPRPEDRLSGLFAVRPLRPWRVLLAVPYLALLHAALFFQFSTWAIWAAGVLFVGTAAALIGLSIPMILRVPETEEYVAPPAPGQPPASRALPPSWKADD